LKCRWNLSLFNDILMHESPLQATIVDNLMKNYDQSSSISMIGENEAYSVPRLSRHNQYGVTDLLSLILLVMLQLK